MRKFRLRLKMEKVRKLKWVPVRPNEHHFHSASIRSSLNLLDQRSMKVLGVLQCGSPLIALSTATRDKEPVFASANAQGYIMNGSCGSTCDGSSMALGLGPVLSISVNPMKSVLSSYVDGRVVVSSTGSSGHHNQVARSHSRPVRSVEWSPSGLRFCSGSDDRLVKVWAVGPTRPKFLCTLKGHTNWVRSTNWSSDEQCLCTTGDDRSVRIWDVSRSQCIQRFDAGQEQINECRFLPSNSFSTHIVASCGAAGVVDLHDMRARNLSQRFVLTSPVNSISFHASGICCLTSRSDGCISMFDLREGRQVWTHRMHTQGNSYARFLGDTSQLISGGADGRIVLSNMGFPSDLTSPYSMDELGSIHKYLSTD